MIWKQRLMLLALLASLWITLSGSYTRKPVVFAGAVLSIILVMWVVSRMDRAVGHLSPRAELGSFLVRMPRYTWFLLGKVVEANLRVTQLLILPSVQPYPRLVRMKVGPETVLGKLILANSITLTPGTVTLDLRAGEILVHALGPISAESVINGDIDREVRRMEGHKGVHAALRPARPPEAEDQSSADAVSCDPCPSESASGSSKTDATEEMH